MYEIIVVGAGAGGLVVAIGAAAAGKKVLLIDKGTWGGDCTNYGCVPSKTLIALAEKHSDNPFPHVHEIVSEVRSHEDPKALNAKGVETLEGLVHFIDPHTLQVGDQTVQGKQIVIATGSSPLVPSIVGLKETPFLTNETIFDLKEIPKSLCVLGGGPIGCELAQAFRRLGADVSLIHRRPYLLKKEEPAAQEVIAQTFRNEGIELVLGVEPTRIDYNTTFTITHPHGAVECDQLLVSLGRTPNVGSLNLEAAGVSYSKHGIDVDKYGRTTTKHIWAIGDVTGGPQFTHAAENQGRTVLTSLLLPWKKRMDKQAVPRVTYTDPEVASFGPLESEVEGATVYNVPMSENDRAVTADRTEGFVKVITKGLNSKIIGATVVGPRAGEMLPELSLAAKEKIPLRKLASLIHPYPTYSLAIRRAGDLWLTQTFLPWLKHFNWKRFIPLIVIVTLMIVAYASGVHKYITFEMLQEQHAVIKAFVAAHPIITPILFTLAYLIMVSLSLPGGAILSLLGGFLFPVPWSTAYVLVGATIGATVIFLAAKTALGDTLRKKAGPFLKKMEKGFQKNAWSYLLFLRFVPLFPFWLVNIAPAFFNVRLLTYVWTTFVGIIPGAYVFTQTGSGLSAIFEEGGTFSFDTLFNWQLRLALIALGLFALLPIFIKKIFAKKRS